MTNTEIATELVRLSKMYAQRGNKHYARALRSQASQVLKGVEGSWSNIIGNAQNGLVPTAR